MSILKSVIWRLNQIVWESKISRKCFKYRFIFRLIISFVRNLKLKFFHQNLNQMNFTCKRLFHLKFFILFLASQSWLSEYAMLFLCNCFISIFKLTFLLNYLPSFFSSSSQTEVIHSCTYIQCFCFLSIVVYYLHSSELLKFTVQFVSSR